MDPNGKGVHVSGIRETRKKQTRKAILQAAIRLFAEKGVEKTSMESLARAAGVGKSTIYGYFKNKQEVFLEFCEDEMNFAFSRLDQHAPDAPVLDQLLTLFMSQFQFVTENYEFGRLMIRETAFPHQPSCTQVREMNARYFEAIEQILSRGVARGELHAGHDPFYACVHFISLYFSALSGWYTGYASTHEEVEKSLRTLFGQALAGLGLPPGKQYEEELSA